jgi:nitrite reductase/ring-hydroxylating ferredoxin subunit
MSGNPARPASGTAIARLAEIADGAARAFDFRVGDALFSVIVARRGESVWAYENVCPHAEFPLERFDGSVLVQAGRYLVCAAHGASFVLESGACVALRSGKGLDRVEVVVARGEVRMA